MLDANLWVVIPAAGVGRRMALDQPKQYLPLAGRTVLEWSVEPFLDRADIAGIVLVCAQNDARVETLKLATQPRITITAGGAERADSVLCGLGALHAHDADWILVHDAARPCLHRDDLGRLIGELRSDAVGGILGAPLSDTLKQADAGKVVRTVSRAGLWRAFTPQMFRYGILERALNAAQSRSAVTDEASAVEAFGLTPRLVIGRADNIKITVPEDLALAECILRARGPRS